VTGAIARTATNFRSGAKTPVAGVVHALTLLAVVLLIAPMAKFIPLATLAAVLFVVAYNMGEWREIGGILRLSFADKSVWLITFVLTVVADLTIAVEVGMALAALLYIYCVSQTTTVSRVTSEYVDDGRPHILQDKQIPGYVTILRIHGPFLFGTTEQLLEESIDLSKFAPIVILRLRNMTAIDATGLHALEALIAVKYFSRWRTTIFPFCLIKESSSRSGGNVGNAHAFSKACGKRCLLSISPSFPRPSGLFTLLLWPSWPVRPGNSGC